MRQYRLAIPLTRYSYPNMRQVLLYGTDVQPARRRRDCHGRWRCHRRWWCSGWCEGREVALTRLITGRIKGCSEVVLGHCWRSDIETRHLSQHSKKRLIGRCSGAGLLTTLIDAIACQVRFSVGVPRQCGAPRSTRPQHKDTCDCSYPGHSDTPLLSPRQQADRSQRSKFLTNKCLCRFV